MAPIFLLIISGLEAFARAVFFIDDAFLIKAENTGIHR